MWDPSSWTRDLTGVPCIARRILNPWTTREIPNVFVSLCVFVYIDYILFFKWGLWGALLFERVVLTSASWHVVCLAMKTTI